MVKTASAPLATLINSKNFFSVTLYTLVLRGGQTIRLAATDAFDPIDLSSNVYLRGSEGSGSPRVDVASTKSKAHWKRGLDVDQWTIGVMPNVLDPFTGGYSYPDVIGSTPWLTGARIGLLDFADVTVSRAYYNNPPPTPPFTTAKRTCVGTLTIFRGFVDTVDATETSIIMTAYDYRKLLDVSMPRNLYMGVCRHQLYDSGCTLTQATYGNSGTVAPGATTGLIYVSGLAAAAGSGTYALGTITFTSGSNSGLSRTIANWNASTGLMGLVSPFPYTPAVGDSFTAYAGCDKSLSFCTSFGNTVNFGGDPYIPTPELQLG